MYIARPLPIASVARSESERAYSLEQPLPDWLKVMEYTRTDIVLLVVATMAVAAFLIYVAFGPMNRDSCPQGQCPASLPRHDHRQRHHQRNDQQEMAASKSDMCHMARPQACPKRRRPLAGIGLTAAR